MPELEYIQLIDLIDSNLHNIEIIKEKYLLLHSGLTSTTYVETQFFLKNVERINQMGTIVVGVINDTSNNSFEIIASGTIIVEPKIIRGGKNVGHIEDIIVAKHMRGKGISQKILDNLNLIARENNCYKVILKRDDKVKHIYIK
jgi:hypothetical protein